jgi:hypothetical protein
MRKPNLYIGGEANPYLLRWHVIPRNRWFNVYLHKIVRDDDDRALHDHPWWSFSVLLWGRLHEIDKNGMNLISFPLFIFRLRSAQYAHRLELKSNVAWTLFITGRRIREWGFHCPQGWRHWKDFTSGEHGETVGKGCD